MSTPEAEFQANEGTPDQKPRGEATDLNEGLDLADQLAAEESVAGEGPPPPAFGFVTDDVDVASQTFKPTTEEEEFLFQDSDPDVPPQAVLDKGRLPDSVIRWLPVMKAAAMEPTAPPALRAVYRAVLNSLEEDLRG